MHRGAFYLSHASFPYFSHLDACFLAVNLVNFFLNINKYGHGVISTLFTCLIIAAARAWKMHCVLVVICKGIKIGKILIHRVGDNGQQVSIEILYLVI
jgi:hypothetical protein